MNIAVVGTGYVGLVSGTCFADTGVNVTCVDVDSKKIERLEQGDIPIYEPGLDELVMKNVKAGRLKFTTSLADIINEQDIVFSAVGTPPDEDGSADLRYVLQVAKTIGENLNKYLVVVTKSTVPVGTARKVKAAIQAELDRRGVDVKFDVASNPEFLKEGNAIKDFMSPDRVVVGVESERAQKMLTRLYKPFLLNNFRVIFMDIPSAEMTKYAANSMLATRISHERHSQSLRARGRRCEHGARGHRQRHTHRAQVPLCRLRLWRQLFPERREGPHQDSRRQRLLHGGAQGRGARQRAAEERPLRQTREGSRRPAGP